MKILLLHAGRALTPALVQGALDELGVTEGDEVRLVSWYFPHAPCPVDRHLVVGPSVLSSVREAPRAADQVEPGPQSDPQDAPDPALEPAPAPPTPSPALPARLGLALTRPRTTARRIGLRLGRVSVRVRSSTRVQKTTSRILRGGVRAEFGAFPLRHPEVREWLGELDLVACLDDNSPLAAWNIARLHPRPAVHSTVGGAAYAAERLRARTSEATRPASSS